MRGSTRSRRRGTRAPADASRECLTFESVGPGLGPLGQTFTRACHRTRMRKYVIFGVQGSGKGTQAKLLVDDLDLVHISVGDILRWHVQRHTKIGAQVRRVMAAGQLVDDELVGSLVRERLELHDWNYGFVI